MNLLIILRIFFFVYLFIHFKSFEFILYSVGPTTHKATVIKSTDPDLPMARIEITLKFVLF